MNRGTQPTGIALWTPRLCLGQPRAAAAPCAGPWSPPPSSQNTRASASKSTFRRQTDGSFLHEGTALPAEFGAFVDPFSLLLFYSVIRYRRSRAKVGSSLIMSFPSPASAYLSERCYH